MKSGIRSRFEQAKVEGAGGQGRGRRAAAAARCQRGPAGQQQWRHCADGSRCPGPSRHRATPAAGRRAARPAQLLRGELPRGAGIERSGRGRGRGAALGAARRAAQGAGLLGRGYNSGGVRSSI